MIRTANIILVAFAAILFINPNSGATNANSAKIISYLNNIVSPLTSAVASAQETFKQNGISNYNKLVKIITTSSNNPYIDNLQYDLNNFRVKLQLKSNPSINNDSSLVNNENETVEDINKAINKMLAGKYIILVPIFAANNKEISAWECITDISISSSDFLEKTQFLSTENGKPSIISELSSAPYLANCSFYDSTAAI